MQQRPEHCFGLALPEVAAVDGAGHAGAGGQRPGPDHRGLGQFTAADGGPAQAAGDVGCELLGVEHGDRAGGVPGLEGDGEVVGARVEVVTTAPGASRIIGITRWRPLPDRGGPTRSIESSTEAHASTPRERPSRYPTSVPAGRWRDGRAWRARRRTSRSPAAAATSGPVATPCSRRGLARRRRSDRRHATTAAVARPAAAARTTVVAVQYATGPGIGVAPRGRGVARDGQDGQRLSQAGWRRDVSGRRRGKPCPHPQQPTEGDDSAETRECQRAQVRRRLAGAGGHRDTPAAGAVAAGVGRARRSGASTARPAPGGCPPRPWSVGSASRMVRAVRTTRSAVARTVAAGSVPPAQVATHGRV